MRKAWLVGLYLSSCLFGNALAESLYSPLESKVYIPFARYQNINYETVFEFIPPDKLLLLDAKPREDQPVYGEPVNVADDLSFQLQRIDFDGLLFKADLNFLGNNLFSISNLAQTANTESERGKVVSNQLNNNYSILQLKVLAGGFTSITGIEIDLPDSDGIEIYKLNYQTLDPGGNLTVASALVSLPKDQSNAYPILAYQHPTIVLNNDAPTRLERDIPSITAAAKGYVTVAADYQGFGDSDALHPFVHASSLATTVIDALRAARHFAAEKQVQLNGQVFLLGYSEGGYATMATQREIERHYSAEFDLVASAPMSGPYDISETMINPFLNDEEHPNPFFFPFVVLGMNQVYGLSPVLSKYFQSPYDVNVPPLYAGHLDGEEINEQLPENRQLYTQTLYDELDGSVEPAYLHAALYENDVYRWKPATKTLMYHCVKDNQVYYANSQVAYDYFIAQGAMDVELNAVEDTSYDFGNVHVNCAVPLLLEGIDRFETMKL